MKIARPRASGGGGTIRERRDVQRLPRGRPAHVLVLVTVRLVEVGGWCCARDWLTLTAQPQRSRPQRGRGPRDIRRLLQDQEAIEQRTGCASRTQAPRPGPPRPRPPRSSQCRTHLAARTQDTPHMKNEHPHVDCWPPRSPTTKQCSMLQKSEYTDGHAPSVESAAATAPKYILLQVFE